MNDLNFYKQQNEIIEEKIEKNRKILKNHYRNCSLLGDSIDEIKENSSLYSYKAGDIYKLVQDNTATYLLFLSSSNGKNLFITPLLLRNLNYIVRSSEKNLLIEIGNIKNISPLKNAYIPVDCLQFVSEEKLKLFKSKYIFEYIGKLKLKTVLNIHSKLSNVLI